LIIELNHLSSTKEGSLNEAKIFSFLTKLTLIIPKQAYPTLPEFYLPNLTSV